MEMQMNNVGWISIYRKIMEDEIYLGERFDKLHAWIDLLLLANIKERKIIKRGVTVNISVGDVVMPESEIAKRWGWCRNSVHKYIKLLESLDKVTVSRNAIVNIIHITNFAKYQQHHEQLDEQLKSPMNTKGKGNFKQPREQLNEQLSEQLDEQLYNKEINNNNNNNDVESARARDTREEQFLDELHNDGIWANVVCMKFRLTADQLSARLDAFALDMQCQAKTHGTLRDMKSHFTNWLRIQIDNETKKQNYERNGWQYANNAVGKRAAAEDERRRRQQEAVDYLRDRLGAAMQGTVQDTSGIHDDLHPGQAGDLLPF